MFVGAVHSNPSLCPVPCAVCFAMDRLGRKMDYNFTVSAFMHAGKDRMALATMIQAHKVRDFQEELAGLSIYCVSVPLRGL